MKKELTKIQAKTFQYICQLLDKGIEVRNADIKKKFKIQSGAAGDRIYRLIDNGWLKRVNNKIRKK
jgi:hypothetical protein